MVVIECSVPNCTFKTNDVSEALAIALITSHDLAHRPSAPLNTDANPALTTTRVPKLLAAQDRHCGNNRGVERLHEALGAGQAQGSATPRHPTSYCSAPDLTLGTACSSLIPTRPLKFYPTYSLPCAP